MHGQKQVVLPLTNRVTGSQARQTDAREKQKPQQKAGPCSTSKSSMLTARDGSELCSCPSGPTFFIAPAFGATTDDRRRKGGTYSGENIASCRGQTARRRGHHGQSSVLVGVLPVRRAECIEKNHNEEFKKKETLAPSCVWSTAKTFS